MLNKLKNFLGIEGVKISIQLDDPIDHSEKAVFGKIILSSLSDQIVDGIELKFIEKYERGRADEKLIDEYELGSMLITDSIQLDKEVDVAVPFTLAYNPLLSEVDQFENENFLKKGLAMIAKSLKGVKSTYKVVAKAKVRGTTLDPIAVKQVILE